MRDDQPVLLPAGRTDVQPSRVRLPGAAARAFASALVYRLEFAQSPDELLTSAADLVVRHARVSSAAIRVDHPKLGRLSAAAGAPVGSVFTVSLSYHGYPAGVLQVTGRSAARPLGRRERRLLVELSPHLGAALHETRLLAAFRQSADRVLYAREEERRRLRQELHDSLGPILAGISLGLHAAQRVMRRDPERAEVLVGHLEGELQSAIAEVRRLFETLRPVVLDQVGLVAAVREQIEILGTRMRTEDESQRDASFSFMHEGDLGTLPAIVEVAAYRIVCEALTNVVRHSRARRCSVTIRRTDHLLVEVVDDGVGMGGHTGRGVGLGSMRERADELGGTLVLDAVAAGGTRVAAKLPIHPESGPPLSSVIGSGVAPVAVPDAAAVAVAESPVVVHHR